MDRAPCDSVHTEMLRLLELSTQQAKEISRLPGMTAEIERLRGEVLLLRATMESAAYQLGKARIWGGMEWHYNPLQPMYYKPALELLREVLDRA